MRSGGRRSLPPAGPPGGPRGAGLELVFSAVQIAASEPELSGSERREFAEDLVMIVLDERELTKAFGRRHGELLPVVEVIVRWLVAATVHVVRSRGGLPVWAEN